MSRVAIALLLACAVAAGLVSRFVPAMEWIAYAFLAFVTAGLLDRRARAGKSVGGPSTIIAVLLAGAGAAAASVSDTLLPLSLGTWFCAAAALLVGFRHRATGLFRFFKSRAAFHGVLATLLTLSVGAAVVSLNVLAARRPLQIDMTRARVHSLAEETMAVLAPLREPLVLHVFHRPDEGAVRARLLPLLRRFADSSRHLRYELHDPDHDPALAARLGVRADGPRVVAQHRAQSIKIEPRGGKLSIIDSRDPSKIISFRDYSEADLATGIIRATRPRPRVCFLEGHGEAGLKDSGERGLTGLAEVLADQNLEAAAVTLDPAGTAALAACKALVIAGPTGALFPAEGAPLRRFVEKGGGLVLLVEGGPLGPLGDLLGAAGVRVREGAVVDPRGASMGGSIVAPTRAYDHPSTTAIRSAKNVPLYFDGARVVEGVSAAARVLLESAPEAYAAPSPGLPFATGRDRQGPLPLAVAAGLGAGRVLVVGDADFAVNRYLRFPGNQLFALGLLRFAAGEEKPIVIKPHGWQHSRLTWTETRRSTVRVLTQAVLPGLAVFFAIYLWRTRRRL